MCSVLLARSGMVMRMSCGIRLATCARVRSAVSSRSRLCGARGEAQHAPASEKELNLYRVRSRALTISSLGSMGRSHVTSYPGLHYNTALRRLYCASETMTGDVELSRVNLKGLKQETSRLVYRQGKKTGKADERLRKELDALANTEELKEAVEIERRRLQDLNKLEAGLAGVKNLKDKAMPGLLELAGHLGVQDKPPKKPPRGPKRVKQVITGPRMPYWTYTSADGTEIRVGRGAEDNDQLSIMPEHRDNANWWLHVSGCPGSHVVIRSIEDDMPSTSPQTLKDAAVLAAKNSKAAQRGAVKVSYTRCRNVSKPAGAKPGLVRLNGNVGTIKVNVHSESARLERLEKTK